MKGLPVRFRTNSLARAKPSRTEFNSINIMRTSRLTCGFNYNKTMYMLWKMLVS